MNYNFLTEKNFPAGWQYHFGVVDDDTELPLGLTGEEPVFVVFACGVQYGPERAYFAEKVRHLRWTHTKSIGDIVAYRIAEKAKPVKPMILDGDPAARKATPITTGLLDYFPRACAEVAKCSKAGNEQHHPGTPLHWDRSKSQDHADCISRHLVDREALDTDGIRHSAKLAWRAMALLEIQLESEAAK